MLSQLWITAMAARYSDAIEHTINFGYIMLVNTIWCTTVSYSRSLYNGGTIEMERWQARRAPIACQYNEQSNISFLISINFLCKAKNDVNQAQCQV